MSDANAPDDDKSIPDETELWRRIPFQQWVPDSNKPEGYRPSSDAFDDLELSVVIVSECAGGLSTLLRGHARYGIASFTVREVRGLSWGIVRSADDELPGHAHVTGKKTHGQRSRLAKNCRMVKNPEPNLTIP